MFRGFDSILQFPVVVARGRAMCLLIRAIFMLFGFPSLSTPPLGPGDAETF
jgi:hypothetical protein